MPQYNVHRWSSVVLMLLLLSSCQSSKVSPVEVNTVQHQIQFHYPLIAREVVPQEVKFKLITPDTALAELKAYESTGGPFVYYGMTEESYLNFSLWLGDVKTHIKNLDTEIGLARARR